MTDKKAGLERRVKELERRVKELEAAPREQHTHIHYEPANPAPLPSPDWTYRPYPWVYPSTTTTGWETSGNGVTITGVRSFS